MPRLYADLDLYTQIKLGLVRVTRKSRPVARFWKYTNKEGPIHPVYGQCWEWTGGTYPKGYGYIGIWRQLHRAYRWAYEELVGPIPCGLSVLHRCDNRTCVNPSHLFLGTSQNNIQDMVDKDRQAKGETINNSKLTEKDVTEIRRRYHYRSYHNDNACELAYEFRVGLATIRRILSRKTWKHVV